MVICTITVFINNFDHLWTLNINIKPTKMKNLILLLTAALFFTFSCKSKKDASDPLDASKDQELLDQYFMAATVGVISASDDLKFVLKEPLTGEVSDDVLQKVITLSPSVEGTVTLSNNTILTFTPKNPLAPNETYTVQLNLMSLDATRFDKNIEYQIKTLSQDMKVEREGIIINENGDVSIILNVKTADKVDAEILKSCFTTDATTVDVMEESSNEYEVDCRFANSESKLFTCFWQLYIF